MIQEIDALKAEMSSAFFKGFGTGAAVGGGAVALIWLLYTLFHK